MQCNVIHNNNLLLGKLSKDIIKNIIKEFNYDQLSKVELVCKDFYHFISKEIYKEKAIERNLPYFDKAAVRYYELHFAQLPLKIKDLLQEKFADFFQQNFTTYGYSNSIGQFTGKIGLENELQKLKAPLTLILESQNQTNLIKSAQSIFKCINQTIENNRETALERTIKLWKGEINLNQAAIKLI